MIPSPTSSALSVEKKSIRAALFVAGQSLFSQTISTRFSFQTNSDSQLGHCLGKSTFSIALGTPITLGITSPERIIVTVAPFSMPLSSMKRALIPVTLEIVTPLNSMGSIRITGLAAPFFDICQTTSFTMEGNESSLSGFQARAAPGLRELVSFPIWWNKSLSLISSTKPSH